VQEGAEPARIVGLVPRLSLIRDVDVRVLDQEMRLYRACRGSSGPAHLDSFRSCWDLIERTRGRIGDHVAELHLGPRRGICVAKPGGPFHWSVWGHPELVAQDADGNFVGETVYGSSLPAAA
jgi:hypothetical protein